MFKNLLKKIRSFFTMDAISNHPPIEALLRYTLINRDSISISEIMRLFKELQKDPRFEELWMPFDRKDLMEIAISNSQSYKVEFKDGDWVVFKVAHRTFGVPLGEEAFSVAHVDRVYGKPWFENEEHLKIFKEYLM